MDHINGGTRMLPGRRVLSSVEKVRAPAAEKKDEEVMEEKVSVSSASSVGRKRRAWQAQEIRRRRTRGAERIGQANWRRALRKLSLMLTLLIWHRRRMEMLLYPP